MNDAALLARLKERYWHLLVHRCQVARPNDFVKFNWFDEELVVFNDHGEFLAFDNICPHRGARIFTDPEGNKHLRCAYHGWSYRKGRFFAPFPQLFDETQLARARFRTLQLQWCGDFLFGSVDPIASLQEQLGETASVLIGISAAIAATYSTNRFEWQSDWQIAIENAIEEYHTAVGLVHPATFGKHHLSKGHDEFHALSSIFRCEYSNPHTVSQLRRLKRLFDIEFQWAGYQSIYLFPFAMIGSTFGYSYALQHFFPSSAVGKCHFTSHMLTSRLKEDVQSEVLAPFFAASDEMNRTIFQEDHAICGRVSEHSLRSDFAPIFAESERKIAKFREWLKQAAN